MEPVSRKKRVLFFSSTKIPFIIKDELVLRKHFDVEAFHLAPYDSRFTAIATYIKVILWLTKNIGKSDMLCVWFADVYAFIFSIFARLYRKKLYIFVGGFDGTWVPELKHGTYHNPRSRFFSKFSYKTATRILPCSQSLVESHDSTFGFKERVEGIKLLYPQIRDEKIRVVPFTYETELFKPDPKIRKTKEIITVGNILNPKTFRLKGLDVYVKTAKHCPEYQFLIVGGDPDKLEDWSDIPSNLTVIPFTQHEDLVKIYQRCKIFMCLSLTGGMPNVLQEAMLCECVPVGYKVSAIGQVICSTGVLLKDNDLNTIKNGLQRAFEMDGAKARQRILEKFPLERREQELLEIFNESD